MKITNHSSQSIRLDLLLCESLKISRRHAKRLCEFNKVSAGTIINSQQSYEINLPEEQSLPDNTYELIHEVGDYYILNKKSQSHMVSIQGDPKPSIEKDLQRKIHSQIRTCQRLDFETLGLFVAAKNQQAFEKFQSDLSQEKIIKHYLARLEQIPQFAVPKLISNGISYKSHHPAVMKADPSGKHFEILLYSLDQDKILVQTKHGFTHVVRLGLSSIGYPLKFDQKYGAQEYGTFQLLAFKIDWNGTTYEIPPILG